MPLPCYTLSLMGREGSQALQAEEAEIPGDGDLLRPPFPFPGRGLSPLSTYINLKNEIELLRSQNKPQNYLSPKIKQTSLKVLLLWQIRGNFLAEQETEQDQVSLFEGGRCLDGLSAAPQLSSTADAFGSSLVLK